MSAIKRLLEDICIAHRDGMTTSEIAQKNNMPEVKVQQCIDEYYEQYIEEL